MAAKINCSPSPCIVSPSVSISGERAASPALSSFPCVFFLNQCKWNAGVNWSGASCQNKWKGIRFSAKRCRVTSCTFVILCRYRQPRTSRSVPGSQTSTRRFGVAVLCPRQSSSITWSSMQLFQNGCLCVSVSLVSEDWAREEICAAANAYRLGLGLERELQRWGLLLLAGSFNQGLSQGSAARLRSLAILREQEKQR